MSSPAITIFNNKDHFMFENCDVYFLAKGKKFLQRFGNIHGMELPNTDNQQARFDQISQWVISTLGRYDQIDYVAIEGYAYAATGRVFEIGENTGLLKHKLFKTFQRFEVFAPLEIKKFAAGSGKASKQVLEQAFEQQGGPKIRTILNQTDKQWNPSSDIIDSYFICKYGVTKWQNLS